MKKKCNHLKDALELRAKDKKIEEEERDLQLSYSTSFSYLNVFFFFNRTDLRAAVLFTIAAFCVFLGFLIFANVISSIPGALLTIYYIYRILYSRKKWKEMGCD